MPKFDPSRKKEDDDGDKGNDLVVPESWLEPRCHVCQSKYRHSIDKMIAMGTAHTEISRIFGGEIDRRSISRHAKKHLNYQEAAIARIIEEEASQAQENAEEGIQGVVKRRVYLQTALHKALEGLQDDKIVVEPRDAVVIIEALNKLDNNSTSQQLDLIKLQFQAFVQAIREVASHRNDPTLGSDILIRAQQIAAAAGADPGELNA